jgi:hypothetical protein
MGACGALAAAPMLNLGRYRLFAASDAEYSERAIRLVRESTVIDMLSPFKISGTQHRKLMTDPDSFAADLPQFRDSGISSPPTTSTSCASTAPPTWSASRAPARSACC